MNTVYEVQQISDLTEGRGPMKSIAFFSNEDIAWKHANTLSGVMGVRPKDNDWRNEKYPDVRVVSHTVHNNLDKFDENIAKEKALAKLTKEERKILGLE